jgi:hypothetical protein
MAVKYSTPRPSEIYPDLDFWYENLPSGNLGLELITLKGREKTGAGKFGHPLRRNFLTRRAGEIGTDYTRSSKIQPVLGPYSETRSQSSYDF